MLGWYRADSGRYIPRAVRQWVISASRQTCIYCGEKGTAMNGPDGRAWTIDHVVPYSKGGTHAVTNFALACASCNMRKSDNDPILPITEERQYVPNAIGQLAGTSRKSAATVHDAGTLAGSVARHNRGWRGAGSDAAHRKRHRA